MAQDVGNWNITGIPGGLDGSPTTATADLSGAAFHDRDGVGATRLTGHHARHKAPEKDEMLWDDEVPGFGLRVLPSGRKRWIMRYRGARCRKAPALVTAFG